MRLLFSFQVAHLSSIDVSAQFICFCFQTNPSTSWLLTNGNPQCSWIDQSERTLHFFPTPIHLDLIEHILRLQILLQANHFQTERTILSHRKYNSASIMKPVLWQCYDRGGARVSDSDHVNWWSEYKELCSGGGPLIHLSPEGERGSWMEVTRLECAHQERRTQRSTSWKL